MPKDQLGKAVSVVAPRSQQNNLQAARVQRLVPRIQSAPAVIDNYWRTKPLPLYSYRDVSYAVEGPDKITRTPQRVYIVTEEDADKVIGFDIEWPYDNKTEQVTKTFSGSYSQHLTSNSLEFPTKLRELIESPNIIKTGFWIANDCGKLMVDFKISPKACIELAGIAKLVDKATLENLGLLKYPNSLKLALMVRLYLKQELAKDETVRISDWSEDLSEEHLEYTANDAHAGLILFKTLEALGNERQIDVDLTSLAGQAASDAIKRGIEWNK
ncbi:hypothetical protein M407DRAFT_25114 [Tulasnella calospora MUT 4182]|uniref:3'-5' exonuclease n=1 Tax=Tulasnella calospora MUT 4182 TaxID=1051891 RepID=A0A0C3QI10_9AGAM|nr:hypothetical protein M407DRAFT_25114 [Tulasnella calospora MUT 4182]